MILSNKTLNFSSIENINNHAKNYKRNYKVCQKLFEKHSEEASIIFKNEMFPLLIENREISNPLRDEVLNWFFSLPLESRFKVITVENSWVINIIHQMYVHYKQDNSTSFQFLQAEKSSEKEADFLNTQIYFQNTIGQNVSNTYENNNNNITINNKYNTNFLTSSVEEQNLQTHFNIKIIKREKHDYYLTTMFLKETRFFSVHSNIDCLSLSPKVLDDKELFLHYFKNFSKDKSFSKLIEVIQDNKTKLYSFGFPKWIEKDFHQITAFIIAFFEHAILIKFILNYNNKNKDKIITSLHDEIGFNEFFKLRKEIIFFLNENYPNNKNSTTNLVSNTSNSNNLNNKIANNNTGNYSNSVKLNFHSEFGGGTIGNFINNNNEFVNKFILNLKVKHIYKNIYNNKSLIESINSRNQTNEKYSEFYQRKLNSQEPLFEGINEEDTEKKIFRLYSNEDIIVFVDNLIFTKIDSIWRLDFFLGIELLQAIHNLYTDKNALDLIKEFDEGKESASFGKNKKNKNKKIKVPELTTRDIEKINFNYYKPYMNKENLVIQNKQQSYQIENQLLDNNGKNINNNNNLNKDYGTITSVKNNISLNNNSIVSSSSEKNDNQLKDSKIINISNRRIKNLTTAKKQNLNREKDKETYKYKDKVEDFSFEKKIIQIEEKIEKSSDFKITEENQLYTELDKEKIEQTEINKKNNYNFILCKEIIIEITDNALMQKENNLKNKIKTLDDVLDNIQAIEKKSKEINKLLTNKLYNNYMENPDNFDLTQNSDLNKITANFKKNQNNNLTIECAYDIELGIKTNSRSNNNLNQENSLKNNFIIENHQISIENSRPSHGNNSSLKDEGSNNSSKNLCFDKNKKPNKEEFEKNINNPKDDYFDEKETSDKDTDHYAIEMKNNNAKNNSSDSLVNNNIKKRRKNNNNSRNYELNTNVNSDSDYEEFINVNKNNREKDSSPAPENPNQDDDSENNNLNVKDKRKKNKKKVQKFYQINIEKMNKKKNILNTKTEKQGTSYTINKSTQTQNTKEINSVNVNLKINNQNLISGNNNSSINNQNPNNNNYKKYDKKNGNPKFNNNNSHNNHATTTNVNINNNLNIHSFKANTNNTSFNKGNSTIKEFSKYDYPKINKKNSFNKGNPIINYTNNGNSESPSEEKNHSNTTLNLSSIINSKNIKEFNYSYSFNNRNGNSNANNYNINFNYDLSNENMYGNSFTNSFSNPFSGNYSNRKKSLNWSEKNLNVSCNNPTFYDLNNSKHFITNNNYLSNNSFNNSLVKPNNNNEFLAYVFKLHYDLVNYHNNVVEIVKCLKDIKINVINYLEKLLKEFIDYELSLDVFGSFASDLSIESSDIDLKVNILNHDSITINYEELIFNLVKKFNSLNIFEFVMPIHTASVPIIKLVIILFRFIVYNLFIFDIVFSFFNYLLI